MKPTGIVAPHYRLYIDGAWRDGENGATFTSTCPADGELLSTCTEAGPGDVAAAVQAARAALAPWKSLDPPQRAALLNKIADLIDENLDRLALVEALDVGRTVAESKGMVSNASDQYRYFASAVRTHEGQATMLDSQTLRLVLSEPLGVVGAIVPWNAPLMIAAWKIAPALAAGNTLVLKPSSLAPLSILELAKLLDGILPPGVLNVITGAGATTGEYLLAHPDVDKLSFTGSTAVGGAVAAAAAQKLIPSTLELGGKSANIVFPDADWKKAVAGTQAAILTNAGQVCCAGSRVFVQEDIYEEFLTECVTAFEALRVGLPWEEGVEMGPLVDQGQLAKVLEYVETGKQEGARLACGGYRIVEGELSQGAFMRPTILADVKNTMRVAQEEIFGPVACFLSFKDEAEAIRLANESDYGLGGGVWTTDLNRALHVARAVETGTMWVNTFLESPSGAPFGGYKKSGYGREVHQVALDYFTQKKTIYIRLD